MRHPSVVTVCGDPGGAAALAPVLSLLSREAVITLSNYAYNEGPAVLAQAGVAAEALPDRLDVPLAERYLRDAQADVLLTATSVNGVEHEKRFVLAARRLGCASIAVLDFWSSYAQRFADEQGLLTCAPDVIAVMDERAADDLRAVGVRADLRITGQPAFDRLQEHRRGFTSAGRSAFRAALGGGPADVVVLFVSQPLHDIYGEPDSPRFLGFDQRTVLPLVAETLLELATDRPLTLAVRPHPRQRSSVHEAQAGGNLRVVVDETPDRWNAVMAADLVVGMNSILLLEACHLGAAVVSLQPGLRGPDMLPSNARGCSASAHTAADARAILRKYVSDPAARQALAARAFASAPDACATERVRDCLYQQLASPAAMATQG